MQKMYKHAGAILLALMLMVAALSVNAVAVGEETLEDSAGAVVAIIPVTGEDDLTYSTLEAAIADAMPGDVIILTTDYTLTESAVIPTGVKLTIPTSASYNDTNDGNNVQGGVTSGSAFVTLTVPAGKTLTVNGTLLVAGNQQSIQPRTGCLTGNFGKIDLAGELEVSGELYARGEISGNGTVTAKSGSKVYQLFQIKDWRGGTKSLAAYNASIFPFNLYEVNSIKAETKYENGASLTGQYYIYASGSHNNGEVPLIGDGAQMDFADDTASDHIIMKENADGEMTATINGDIKTGHIAISLKQFGFNFSITSSYAVCPFGYNMDVVITNGSSMEITNNLKILPGCDITNNGTLTVDAGKTVYFYGADGYSAAYNFAEWTSAAPATLTGTGTLVNNGTVASTDPTFANMSGHTAARNEDGTAVTVTMDEYVQASGSTPVTFTVGAAASSAEEPAAEFIEEIEEAPAGEIAGTVEPEIVFVELAA